MFMSSFKYCRLNKKKADKSESEKFFSLTSNDQLCKFFAANSSVDSFSEKEIAQYFCSIPGHNANCERIFSLLENSLE